MMKKFLIDTHVLLWWLDDSSELSPKAREYIRNPHHVISVSVVCVWELMLKKSLGKLSVPDGLEKVLLKNHFSILDVGLDHSLGIEHLEDHHRDPFDRMLLCQAKVEGIPLITHDKVFEKYKDVDVILV